MSLSASDLSILDRALRYALAQEFDEVGSTKAAEFIETVLNYMLENGVSIVERHLKFNLKE